MDLGALEANWELLDDWVAVHLGECLPDQVQVASGWVDDAAIELVTSELISNSGVQGEVLVRWYSPLLLVIPLDQV